MCIIIAKNAKVSMPSEDILRTCFAHNPDGAGFMLAFKGKVFGFKGLMTADELIEELHKAEKRFGSLDKLPVVIHCRITTHGATCQANTHPFPLGCGYREMRKTEWIARQGFAHNGVMYSYGRDPDVKKFNVSDTMVFGKKVASPIAKYAEIANDPALMDLLFDIASSKLCFLSGRGKLATRGEFTEQNGVLYSNTSFRETRLKPVKSVKPYSYSYADYDSYGYAWRDADYGFDKPNWFGLSRSEIDQYRSEIEQDSGYTRLQGKITVWINEDEELVPIPEHDLSIDEVGNLYEWVDEDLDFLCVYDATEYVYVTYNNEEKGGES